MRKLNPTARKEILIRLRQKCPKKSIADALNVHVSTVYRIASRNRHLGWIPPKVDPQKVLWLMATGRAANASQAANILSMMSPSPVSSRSVRDFLLRHRCVVLVERPIRRLTDGNVCYWKYFAEHYGHWTVADWEKVLFYSEAVFQSTRLRGLSTNYYKTRVHHVYVWVRVAVTAAGIRLMTRNESFENDFPHEYSDIFGGPSTRQYVNQASASAQANARFDTDPLDWKLHSQDYTWGSPFPVGLNPMSSLWSSVLQRVNARQNPTALMTTDHLWEVLETAVKQTPVEEVRQLFASMPGRMEAVLKEK